MNLAVARGSIHGIVGENGAGKSTLMSILYGFYEADAGEIRVDGKPVRIRSPREAHRRPASAWSTSISCWSSHLSVLETSCSAPKAARCCARGDGARPAPSWSGWRSEYGLDIDPDAIVGDLSVGLQQRVEILKALYRGADILILDEPTAVLTPAEADAAVRACCAR